MVKRPGGASTPPLRSSALSNNHHRPAKRTRTTMDAQNGHQPATSSSHPHFTGNGHASTPTLQPNAAATALISQYVGSLRNDLSTHNAVYTCRPVDGGGFACSIVLPFNSPVGFAESEGAFRSKQLAKQSAAYNAAVLLMAAGEISDTLMPTPSNPSVKKGKGAANGNANGNGESSTRVAVASGDRSGERVSLKHLHPDEVAPDAARGALGNKKRTSSTGILGQEQYGFVSSPRWWSDAPPMSPTGLHPAVITLSFGDDSKHSAKSYWKDCRALVMLTSVPLPILENGSFPLDISQPHIRATATLKPFASVDISKGQMDAAFAFTHYFFRALLNKAIDADPEKTAYFVLPMKPSYPRDGTGSSFDVGDIAWDEVARAESPFTRPFDFSGPTLGDLEDAIVSSAAELGRRFYVSRVRSDLNASSPDNAPGNEGMTYLEAAIINEPWEYRNRNRKSNDLVYPDQLLLEVEAVVAPKSGGVVASLMDTTRGRGKIVIPELLEKHFVSASVYRTGTMLVAALGALDDELIAAELSTRFSETATQFGGKLGLQRSLVREAITCPASRAYPGASNYERLEILGDTVLKLATSVAVYVGVYGEKVKDKNEGTMSYDRHKIVSNRALQSSIIESGLVPYIRGTNRRARDFVPPMWWVTDGPDPFPTTQVLGDKTVADVAEALIAAAYLSSNRSMQAALDSMHVLHIDSRLGRWHDLATRRSSVVSPRGTQPLTLLGYAFKNPNLGWMAINLKHQAQDRYQFERLEFLGDAVIDLLTLEPLWTEHPDLGPAPLTHMKHSRVGNTALAAFLVCSGLYQELTGLDPVNAAKMAEFASTITAKRAAADRAQVSDPSKPNAKYEFWNSIPGHKWMGDIVEVVFGAIFEDCGFDLDTVGAVFTQHLHPFVSAYAVPPHAHSLHPKSVLLELLANRKCTQWSIERSTDGQADGNVAAAVLVHGTVVGSAVEAKTALAVRNACEEAIVTLKEVGTCPCM